MDVESYSKLLLHALWLYWIVSKTFSINTIGQHEVPSTISAQPALLAPNHMQTQDDIVDDEYNQPLSDISVRKIEKPNHHPGQGRNSGSQMQEYTVDHIVRNVDNCRQRKYVCCSDMDIRPMTIRWNHRRTFCNTSPTPFGRKSEKGKINAAQSIKTYGKISQV